MGQELLLALGLRYAVEDELVRLTTTGGGRRAAASRMVLRELTFTVRNYTTTRDVTAGGVTLRHDNRLHHIKVGRRHAGTRVLMLVAGLEIRIVDTDGELLRTLTLDPSKTYQPLGKG